MARSGHVNEMARAGEADRAPAGIASRSCMPPMPTGSRSGRCETATSRRCSRSSAGSASSARASRFCGAKPRLTDAELALLARVDAERHVLVGYVDGDPRPAGIARLVAGRRARRDRPQRGGRAPRARRRDGAARGARGRRPRRRDHVLRRHRLRRQPVDRSRILRKPLELARGRAGSGRRARDRSSRSSALSRPGRPSRTALPSARAAPAARRGRCGTRSACPCSSSPRRASPRAARRAARAS